MKANATKLSPINEISDEEINVPIDMSDILNVCREYNKLGWNIQNQIEQIMELGVHDAIKAGTVKLDALPHIKEFLFSIRDNAYFGDAASQANDCIDLIDIFEILNVDIISLNKN